MLRLIILFATCCYVFAGTEQEELREKRAVRGEISVDGFDWTISSKRVPRGSPPEVELNVTLTTQDNNAYVYGKRLWRLGLFGSEWKDGWGTRKNEVRQLLSPKQQNQRARGGLPISFMSVEGEFDYTDLGCDGFRYLCFEFAKGDNPRPDFNIRFYTFQQSMVECTEVDCQRPDTSSSPSCTRRCPYEMAPVCGDDGNTYATRCDIENQMACAPNEPLNILFEDNCNNSVTVRSIFWGVEATNYNRHGLSELTIDAIVFTNGPIDVSGTNLWRLGIFGSRFSDGHGPRMGYQRQILNATEANLPLVARHTISLMFLVSVQFDVSTVGCNRYKYLCLELAKGDEATPDFPFRSSNGKGVFIGCRTAPCNGPEGDGTGRPQVLFDSFQWAVRAFGTITNTNLVNIILNVTAVIQDRSDEIRGTNLWRIGLFGSARHDGSGDRFGYIRQTITDDQVSTPAIPGQEMSFSIPSQFRINGVGCGDFNYLCTEIGKGDNPDPDFIINLENDGRPFVACQRIPCQAQPDHQRPAVARLSSLDWNLEVTDLHYNGPSTLTVQFTVSPAPTTDTIEGKGLWRLGLYFSASEDGYGDRHMYQSQILPKKYANLPLTPRSPTYFLDILTEANVVGLGCDEWQFVCVEFAKGWNPRPNFALPLPGGLDFVVSCRRFPCIEAPASQDLRTTIDTFTWNFEVLERPQSRQQTQILLNVSIPVPPDSDMIEGRFLWRVGMYGATRKNGRGDKFAYVRQTILDNQVSMPAIPGNNLEFLINTRFDVTDVGCGEVAYICVELAKGDFPDPEFIFNAIRKGRPIVVCQIAACQGNYDQAPRAALLSSMNWNYQVEDLDSVTNITFNVITHFADDLDIIEGTGLWRLGVFFSSTKSGRSERHRYEEQILPSKYADKTLNPREAMIFSRVTKAIELSGVGCGKWRYICAEFAKGSNPSSDFELEYVNGRDTEVDCKIFPCVAGNSVNNGPLQSTFDSIIWKVTAERSVPGELSNVTLHVSIPVPPTSSEIQGQDLWRVGLYGSRWSNGTSDDKFGYVRQVIPDDMDSPPLIPGNILEINTLTTFMVSGLGCGEYDYLCVEVAKGDNADPEFLFNPRGRGKPVVLCQWVQCQDPGHLQNHENQRQMVARLSSLYWDAEVTEYNFARESNLTFHATILPTSDTDEIEGQGLWRFGMFFSNTRNGQNGRLHYIPQILPQEFADHPLSPWQALLFLNVTVLVDVTGLGCDSWHYLCIEFAKGKNATPEFDLPMPGGIEVAVACKLFPCIHAADPAADSGSGEPNYGNEPRHDSPPNAEPEVTVSPQTLPATTSLAPTTTISAPERLTQLVVRGVSLLIPPTAPPIVSGQQNHITMDFDIDYDATNSDRIEGVDIWRIKVWGSSRKNGGGKRISQNGQVLTVAQASKTLIPGRPFTIRNIEYDLNLVGKTCSDVLYICAQLIAGKTSPQDTFTLRPVPNKKSLLGCQRITCRYGVEDP